MDVGDYLTNIVSTHELSSIRYTYLETAPSIPYSAVALRRVAARWQRSGYLVANDDTRRGLWVFQSGVGDGDRQPSPWATTPTGQTTTEDVGFVVKHAATCDFSTLADPWKAHKQAHDSQNGMTPTELAHTSFRSTQNVAHNNQALASNAAIDIMGMNTGTRDGTEDSFISIQNAHDLFLAAVMSSISTMLCSRKGYIPMGFRTLVIPSQHPSPDQTRLYGPDSTLNRPGLITLTVDYTAGKVLVVKATLSQTQDFEPCRISPHQPGTSEAVKHHSLLVLGPGGHFGKLMGTLHRPEAHEEDKGAPVLNSTSYTRVPHLASWIRRCLDWLGTKGLDTDLLDAEHWVLVELCSTTSVRKSGEAMQSGPDASLEKLVIVPWPSSLCFQRQAAQAHKVPVHRIIADALDPLEFAQTWLMGEEERARISSKRKQEREAAEAARKLESQGENGLHDISHMTSPLALRRSSLAGMVYPTPPDGVNAGIGATPSFDCSMSTPGQPTQPPAEVTASSIHKLDTEDIDQSVPFPQHNSDFAADGHNDNLFGDMDDYDLFGDDKGVTDADFSFFDQPDHSRDMSAREAIEDRTDLGQTSVAAEEALQEGRIGEPSIKNYKDADVIMGNTDNGVAGGSAFPGVQEQMLPRDKDDAVMDTDDAVVEHKVPSPPLRPDTVFRRLSTIRAIPSTTPDDRQKAYHSHVSPMGDPFGGMDLTPAISTFQEKYGPNGRFIYPSQTVSPALIRPTGIPTTDYFRRRRQRKLARPTGSTLPHSMYSEADDQSGEKSIMITGASPFTGTPRSLSDTDDSSDDDGDFTSANINSKRKREIEDEGESSCEEDLMSASLRELKVDQGGQQGERTLESYEPLSLDGDSAGWSLARYLAWPDSWTNGPILSDPDFIAASQILTDQATSQNFLYPSLDPSGYSGSKLKKAVEARYCPRYVQQDVLDAAQHFFTDAEPCTLQGFLCIRGNMRAQPRPPQNGLINQASNASKSVFFEIPPPHLEVRRSESRLSVLPAAIQFWDVLGLAPRQNSKDVIGICLYPAASTTENRALLFMENMRSAYETRRFGSHGRLATEEISSGAMALNLDHAAHFSSDHGMSFVNERLTDVLKAIVKAKVTARNFVVYFVYEPEDAAAIVGICGAFDLLLRRYRVQAAGQLDANELVLQLVPLNIVGTRTKIVMPPPAEFAKLAFEVYDRCYDFEHGWPSPSITVEPPLRSIVLKPGVRAPSVSLLEENSVLHIAYAQSIDDRWISVAWSDNSGNEQFTTSYCLGRKGDPLSRQFHDIAHEIWKTTIELISAKKVHWRLFIAKCEPMEMHEVEFWCGLADTEGKDAASISLTILTVDTAPSLQLLPGDVELSAPATATQTAFSSTPVSTPQGASVLSPDSGMVGTPVDTAQPEVKVEPDATLLEISDQTYGAILSQRANNANCLLDVQPAMYSGYVIKRGGSVPKAMEVSIIWMKLDGVDRRNPNHPQITEQMLNKLMQEILAWYGGLATLARARGAVDAVGDPRPWHVIMAERVVRALYVLM